MGERALKSSHPRPHATVLAELESFQLEFSKFDTGPLSPDQVYSLIESALSVAENAGRLFVVRQDNDAPRALADRSRTLLGALAKRKGEASLPDPSRHAFLEVRCYETLMDVSLRQVNPWGPPREAMRQIADRFGEFERWYNAARDRLVEFGQRGQGMAERFSRLRLLRARKGYLSGRFGHAAEELNAAHAFAERASEGRGAALAICHVHRAEHCILFFRSIAAGAANQAPSSLIDEALTALEEAEAEFGGGRRDVFWMVRLFILRARAQLERLRLRVAQRHRASTPDRAANIELERTACAALSALYGAWVNNHENPQRTSLIGDIWDELRRVLEPVAGAPPAFDVDWEQLNVIAGLDGYRRARPMSAS